MKISRQHKIRIIGGKWKRTPLKVLKSPGLRPTPNRIRETIFNWLTYLINDWKKIYCLDIFAGSGALGFEAASRGAFHVTMIEQSLPAIFQLKINQAKLNAEQITIKYGDAFTILKKLSTKSKKCNNYNIIFADPPYYQNWLAKIMPLCEQFLTKQGYIYVKSEYSLINYNLYTWMTNWKIVKSGHAGLVFYYLLNYKNNSLTY